MKKNYFYSLFAALMLFVAMPTAAQVTMADLYGKWRFTADIEWGATATEAQKAQISNECDVIIAADDITTWYEAKIVGFAGSKNAQFADMYQSPSSGTYAAKVANPNPTQAALFEGMLLANANGDNPYGIFEGGEWVVKSLGTFYYILNEDKTEMKVQNDFTIVTVTSNEDKNPVVVATLRNAKMTLVEAAAPVAAEDISGEYLFKAGTTAWSTMEGSTIPTEFAVNVVNKSTDNKAYDVTIAIEGYDNVTLPATYNGSILSMSFDNSYIKSDYSVLENSIRFADYNTLASNGTIEFSGVKGAMSNISGIALASDSIGKNKAGDADSTYTVRRQYYMDGAMTIASDAPEVDWAGSYDVKVADASKDVIIAGAGVDATAWPAEFKMEVANVNTVDGEAPAITSFMGYDLSFCGGWLITPAADGKTATVDLAGWNDIAPLKSNGDGTYLVMTNSSGQATTLTLTLNEDGTIAIESCFVQTYEGANKFAPVVFYQNLTAAKVVEEAPAFDWAGKFTLTAGKVDAYDGNTYPENIDIVVEYNEGWGIYLVTEFNGNNIASLNQGGLELIIAEDGKSATVELSSPYMGALGYLQTIEAGVSYLKLRDMNKSANSIALTLNADGTVSMDNFTLVVGAYGSEDGNNPVAYYQDVTATKLNLLDEPVLVYPYDDGKGVNAIDWIQFNFNEPVDVSKVSGLAIKAQDGSVAANVVRASLSSDFMTVYFDLDQRVSAPGVYTLEVPAGMITNVDGGKSFAGAKYTFNVVAPAPEFYFNPWGGSVQKIETISVSFSNVVENGVVVDESKFSQVQLMFGGVPTGNNANISIETKDGDSTMKIAFDEAAEEVGEYQLYIPAGLFTMNGTNGTAVANNEITLDYTIIEVTVTPLEIVSVTPVQGEVDKIETIIVEFNQHIRRALNMETWQSESYKINLVKDNGDVIELTETGNVYLPFTSLEYAVGSYADNGWELIIEPITEAGTYTLDASQILVDYSKDEDWNFHGTYGSCEGTYTWTIAGGGSEEPEVDIYAPTNVTSEFKSRDDRPMTNVKVGEETYELDATEQTKCYVNKYESVTFTVEAGKAVAFEVNTTASWIHGVVYIDFDNNGFTAGVENNWEPTGDLVAYAFYNNDSSSDESGWNSVGQSISGDNRNRPEIPSYTIPADMPAGEYRIRFKLDWCNIDPNGDADGKFNDFMGNGGQILDAKLVVTEPIVDSIEGVDAEAENAVIYDLTGRRIVKITKAGIYIVNGKKVFVK